MPRRACSVKRSPRSDNRPANQAANAERARLLKRFAEDERFRIEGIFKILEADTRQVIPLRFNEAQMRLYQTYRWFRDHRLPVRVVICKSRRAGLSTGVSALIYDDTTSHANSKSLIVANEKNPSENVLGMYTRFWRESPEYFELDGQRILVRPPLPPAFNSNPPKDRLIFDLPLDSAIYVATARSIDAYLGYGFQNVHATEASRYIDGHELFRALYPTISKKSHSALYVESTPNGQEGRGRWFHEQCMDAAARKNTEYGEMRLVFIPWHEMTYSFAIPFTDEAKKAAFGRSLIPAEKDLLRRFPNISLEQLAWRRMMLAGPTFNRDEDIFDQEYPTDLATAFMLSGNSVFGRKQIKRLMSQVREPEWVGDIYWGESDKKNESEPIHDLVRRPKFLTKGQAIASGFASHVNEGTFGNLKVYRWPNPGERCFIACDVGGGNPETRDGDYSTMGLGVLNEWGRDELIAVWRGHINPIAFAEVASAFAWAVRYKVRDKAPAPELVPEWTGPGSAMCVYIDNKNLYPNLYRYQQPGVHKMPASKHVGWESNAKTKPTMVAWLLRGVDRDLFDIPDEEVVREMSSYRQHDNFGDEGSYGGAAGQHDDLVSMTQILYAVMRIRAQTIPGNAEVLYTDENDRDDFAFYGLDEDGDMGDVFDPFARRMPQTGQLTLNRDDVDEDALEEALFWNDD